MKPPVSAAPADPGGEKTSATVPAHATTPTRVRPGYWRLLFATIALGWLAFFFLHPQHLIKVGVPHIRVTYGPSKEIHEVWFFDSLAILASNDAVAAGRDPYVPNPLDFQNRAHVYGPWWLQLHKLGLTRTDNLRVGLVLGGIFFVTVVWWLRPRDLRSLLWYLAVFCTTPVLLALERANNDLVIFLLLWPIVPCLLSARPVAHWFAIGLIAIAADLKFYPAVVGLVLLAIPDPREMRRVIAGALALLALVVWHLSGDFGRIARLLPTVEGIFTFGAVAGLHELGWQGPWPQLLATLVGVGVLVGCWRSRVLEGWTPTLVQRSEWLHFVLGGILLAGCFFSGQNHYYRWIFALWLAPLLWSLMQGEGAPSAVRRLARVTGGLLLASIWIDALCALALSQMHGVDLLSALHWIFVIEQPVTWAFFICLLLFLAHFGRSGLKTLFARS